jgi:hypothetical protein
VKDDEEFFTGGDRENGGIHDPVASHLLSNTPNVHKSNLKTSQLPPFPPVKNLLMTTLTRPPQK